MPETIYKPVPFFRNSGPESQWTPPQGGRPYIGWQLNRHRNPFFEIGTGFEPYFIRKAGETPTSHEEVVEKLATLGQSVFDGIVRLHPHTIRRMQILEVLTQEKWNPAILSELDAWLGLLLGKLRAEYRNSPAVQAYRDETARLVSPLGMQYKYDEGLGQLMGKYQLPQRHLNSTTRLNLETIIASMPDSRQAALILISNLGRVGDLLVRKRLSQQ